MDNINWNLALKESLADYNGAACDVPIEEFPLDDVTRARYLKFKVISVRTGATNGGLNYLGWKQLFVENPRGKCTLNSIIFDIITAF